MAAAYIQPARRTVNRSARRRTPRAVRRARTLAALFCVSVSCALFLFPRIVHTESHTPPAGVPHTVVYGDTLWDIAAQHAGDRDVRQVIHQIQRLNGLDSAQIHPGQVLLVPTAAAGR